MYLQEVSRGSISSQTASGFSAAAATAEKAGVEKEEL